MSKTDKAKCSNISVIAFLVIFIHFCTSAPVSNDAENAYTQFIAELNRNKCSVPSQVQLPFDTTEANNFEYLSSYLKICQKTESTKRNKEAVVLCKEIFDNIRNISCPIKTALPDISVNLSENVCQDISVLQNSVPEDDKSLLKRLTDTFLCDIMCDNEFEKACQVLLWSFDVRKQIASVASAQEPEQDVQEGGEDMNGENKISAPMDSLKQDNALEENVLPEGSVNLEHEKKNADEAKDVNEVVGQDGVTEEAGSSEIDNPGQNPEYSLTSDRKGEQEKPVPSNKESVPENQANHEAKSQDSTGASKSVSSTKTPSSPTQQKPGVQALSSNAEVKPEDKITKSESIDQNTSNQLKVDITKHDEVTAGELPQGSNTKAATDEQTQDANANSLADSAVQGKKDTGIPAKQNILVSGENNIPGETHEIGDQKSDFPNNNDLPHESAHDAAADLPNNGQDPSDLNTMNQKKIQTTAGNDDDLAKKTNPSTTNSQAVKDTAGQQAVQEVTQDKTDIARDETKANQPQTKTDSTKADQPQTKTDSTKADQPQTKSDSTKAESQDVNKMNQINHGLVADDGTGNTSTDQKKPKVAPKTGEIGNTIPDTTGTMNTDEKPAETSQGIKPTVVDPAAKSVVPSSLTETSTKITVALEKMEGGSDPHQPAGEEDHYGDPDNTEDDDYNRREYDGFYEVSKTKESSPDVSSPITAAKEILTSQNERPMEFPSRNAFGQDSSGIQLISTFPEQEDSHFFFYFLSIVLILMAGYLLFHNKQKIIALIVEGRHERNRRSHRVGYKKLETK